MYIVPVDGTVTNTFTGDKILGCEEVDVGNEAIVVALDAEGYFAEVVADDAVGGTSSWGEELVGETL